MMSINLKNILQITLIVIILIFTTKFFQSTPFEALFFQLQAIFLVLILIFILLYISDIMIKKKPIDKVVLYFILLIFFMPLYSAYRSNAEFGQPYLYGILSQRGWLILGVGIWFYYMIIRKKIALTTIESSFVLLSWGSLLLFALFALTFDPAQMAGDEKFAIMTEGRGLRFLFLTFFITFGSLYYFIKYSMHKRILDLLVLIAFLIYVVLIIQGRTYMVFLAITIFLYYYFNHSFSQFILNITKTLLFFIGFLVLLQIFMPGYIQIMVDLFGQMFTVLGAVESTDASANARIFESLTVFNYFDTHSSSIWLGTGRLSSQWNDGYKTFFGYFYPEDIGLLGGIFLYGVLGMIFLLVVPLVIEIKEIKKATDTKDVFMTTIKYMLIMSIIQSPQGGLYFGANVWIVLFFILYARNRLNRSNYETA